MGHSEMAQNRSTIITGQEVTSANKNSSYLLLRSKSRSMTLVEVTLPAVAVGTYEIILNFPAFSMLNSKV